MSRLMFYIIVGLLLVAGVATSVHRHVQFEIPWLPGEQRQVWEIEAGINFNAQDGPVQVDLALPSHQAGYRVLTENTASSGYGLAYQADELGRTARWTIREAVGSQTLYYSVQMLVSQDARSPVQTPPEVPVTTPWESPYDTAASQLIEQAWARSANNATFARELIRDINGERQEENARLLLSQENPAALVVRLLNQAGVQAREVSGLLLEDGRRRAVLEVQGGTNSRVTFSMMTHDQPASAAVRNHYSEDTLLNFSIHSLPLEEQALFQTILLIPIGALMVVFLRVLVGIKTSGTFMPVLIALAFIQTSLPTGLIGFLLIVAVGLIIRNYLSYLNLLLVARVSAVIITVIAIISIFTVLAYRMGLSAGLTITFFPMIILAWTIERMSILWEEEGPKQVLIQGGGSLITAILAYLAMNNPWVRHITFNFLGVQLILMALILLLGNYTGYRLLELRRFKPITDDEKPS